MPTSSKIGMSLVSIMKSGLIPSFSELKLINDLPTTLHKYITTMSSHILLRAASGTLLPYMVANKALRMEGDIKKDFLFLFSLASML